MPRLHTLRSEQYFAESVFVFVSTLGLLPLVVCSTNRHQLILVTEKKMILNWLVYIRAMKKYEYLDRT